MKPTFLTGFNQQRKAWTHLQNGAHKSLSTPGFILFGCCLTSQIRASNATSQRKWYYLWIITAEEIHAVGPCTNTRIVRIKDIKSYPSFWSCSCEFCGLHEKYRRWPIQSEHRNKHNYLELAPGHPPWPSSFIYSEHHRSFYNTPTRPFSLRTCLPVLTFHVCQLSRCATINSSTCLSSITKSDINSTRSSIRLMTVCVREALSKVELVALDTPVAQQSPLWSFTSKSKQIIRGYM